MVHFSSLNNDLRNQKRYIAYCPGPQSANLVGLHYPRNRESNISANLPSIVQCSPCKQTCHLIHQNRQTGAEGCARALFTLKSMTQAYLMSRLSSAHFTIASSLSSGVLSSGSGNQGVMVVMVAAVGARFDIDRNLFLCSASAEYTINT